MNALTNKQRDSITLKRHPKLARSGMTWTVAAAPHIEVGSRWKMWHVYDNDAGDYIVYGASNRQECMDVFAKRRPDLIG